MKISELPFLRDQWYAIARSEEVRSGPVAVRLLGESFVLWAPAFGSAVLADGHCPHRGAHLAAGTVIGDCLRCCYHGWEFDSSGSCVKIPQLDANLPIPPKARVRTYPVVERYGMWWACIGDPASDGPPLWEEAEDLGWRVQVDFFEEWSASALRIVDNNIDQSHPAFVHQGTFGNPARPSIPPYELVKTTHGFSARIPQSVDGVGPQMGEEDEGRVFERWQEVELLDPVHTRIRLSYDGPGFDYSFYGSATPIDDERSMYVRVSALSGTEEEQPYDMFYEYSRRVTLEDKVVLETTLGDFPLDNTSEVHLRCDRTTLFYRRYLAELFSGVQSQTQNVSVPTMLGSVV